MNHEFKLLFHVNALLKFEIKNYNFMIVEFITLNSLEHVEGIQS